MGVSLLAQCSLIYNLLLYPQIICSSFCIYNVFFLYVVEIRTGSKAILQGCALVGLSLRSQTFKKCSSHCQAPWSSSDPLQIGVSILLFWMYKMVYTIYFSLNFSFIFATLWLVTFLKDLYSKQILAYLMMATVNPNM